MKEQTKMIKVPENWFEDLHKVANDYYQAQNDYYDGKITDSDLRLKGASLCGYAKSASIILDHFDRV